MRLGIMRLRACIYDPYGGVYILFCCGLYRLYNLSSSPLLGQLGSRAAEQ